MDPQQNDPTTYERKETRRKSRAAFANISKRKVKKANAVAEENVKLAYYAAKYYEPTGIDETQLLSLAGEALIIGTRIHDPKLGTLATAVMMRMRGLVSHERKTLESERRGGGVNHDVSYVTDDEGNQKQYEDKKAVQPIDSMANDERYAVIHDALENRKPEWEEACDEYGNPSRAAMLATIRKILCS